MSKGSLNLKGTPNTDTLDTVRLLRYCGGGGGGGCTEPLGVEGVMLAYRVPRFITFNRKIIFENKEFLGIQIFDDAGPAGFCDHSVGTEHSFWLGLTADGTEDIETAAKRGFELSGTPPYNIEFPADMCPQPDEAAWENIVYVAVWWGDAAFMISNVTGAVTEQALDLKKHDKDTRQ